MCWSAIAGVVTFAICAQVAFSAKGENVVLEYATDIAKGNVDRLQFYYYRTLFAYYNQTAEVTTALRNSIVGAFVLYAILLFGSFPKRRSLISLANLVALGICVLIVATSVSRSNGVALALSAAVISFSYSVQNKRAARGVLVSLLAFVVVGGFFAVISMNRGQAVSIVTERYGTDVAEDVRGEMFLDAFNQATKTWWSGKGYASPISFQGHTGRVHNLILSSFYETGIAGLALSVLFYLGLIGIWLHQIFFWSARKEHWSGPINVECVLALPALPTVRCMLSGNGGTFTLIEWICLALFIGWTSQSYAALKSSVQPAKNSQAKDAEAGDTEAETDYLQSTLPAHQNAV